MRSKEMERWYRKMTEQTLRMEGIYAGGTMELTAKRAWIAERLRNPIENLAGERKKTKVKKVLFTALHCALEESAMRHDNEMLDALRAYAIYAARAYEQADM